MIRDLKPYPIYKDSGTQWLGDVPEHWEVKPSRALFSEVKDQNHPEEPLISVTISRGVMSQADLLSDSSKKDSSNLDKSKYKLIQPGDIVYNKMRAWQGAIGASPLRGIVSPAYIVQRPRSGVLPEYMHFLFRTPSFATEAERWSYGITSDQWSLRSEHFKMIYCSVPSWSEQAAIVRFLHHADQRIRRYIIAKQRLIKLLKEQNQAIIERIITKGSYDAGEHSTQSDTAWVDQVPQNWQVLRLQYLLDPSVPLTYGILLPGPRLDEGVPYLGAGDVRPDKLRLDVLPRTTDEIAAAYPRTRMRAGDLVYAIRGSFGSVEVIPPELEGVNLSRDAARLAPRSDVDSHWLAFALRTPLAQRQFALREIGATITGVNIRDLKRVLLPVPSQKEQHAIVSLLREATDSLRQAIDAEERGISLLRDYRMRLFVDVVTGKLDVRRAAATLPDEAEEAEELSTEELLVGDADAELASEELAEEEVIT